MNKYASLDAFAAKAGSQVGVSPWLEITQDMIDRFADVTGDHQWIHVDPERCRKELGTGTIAHGYLILSLIAGFSAQSYVIEGLKRAINYGSNQVRFLAPTPPGSRVRAVYNLIECVPDKNRFRARNRVSMEIEGSERPALVAETVTLFYL
ncbi:MAG: MaoC family dehydratase [Fimbriimonadaceae bacterium]|nr:MaoC family dehydratase [Alphaproteobacteria bacterium]